MVKNFIIRDELYSEENRQEYGISLQVCVVLDHIYNKKVMYYETSKQNGLLVKGKVLHTDVPLQGTERIIFHVRDQEIAMKLAYRWCEENSTVEHKYTVIGVDNYFSPLD